MSTGFIKERRNAKMWSLPRTFGSVSMDKVPENFSVDSGLTMPDQNSEGYPFGCGAYMTNDLAIDQDLILYSVPWYFEKACELAKLPLDHKGMSMEQWVAPVRKVGLLPVIPQGDPDEAAGAYKRPVFWFELEKGKDHFDSIRSQMLIVKDEKRGMGLGTDWFFEFSQVGKDGILNEDPKSYSGGHAYAIKGWTHKNSRGEFIRNGEIFLKAKPWAGKNYGDNGFVYISRKLCNKLMSDWGAVGITIKDTYPGEIQTIEISLLKRIIDLFWSLIENLRRKETENKPKVEPTETQVDNYESKPMEHLPPAEKEVEKVSKLKDFALAIQSFEGYYPGSRSYRNQNPGNLRYTSYTKSLGAIGKDPQNFCIFSSYLNGFNALKQFILDAKDNKLKAYKNCTILTFFQSYAPATDENNPLKYATYIANRLDVSIHIKIKDLV